MALHNITLSPRNMYFVTTFVNINASLIFWNDIIVYGMLTQLSFMIFQAFSGINFAIFQWTHTKMQE